MATSAPDYVRKVMAALGVTSPTQLADKMRWPRGTERLVSKWLAGDARPSFDYVVEMGEKSGLMVLEVKASVTDGSSNATAQVLEALRQLRDHVPVPDDVVEQLAADLEATAQDSLDLADELRERAESVRKAL